MIRGPFNSLLSCLCIMVLTFQIFGFVGLRINTSPSLPIGIYIKTSDPTADLVEFCPAEPYAHFAIVRGYRDAGNCDDGGAPFLKPVIAQSGDLVEVSPGGISVNGKLIRNTAPISADSKGRPLVAWPAGRSVVPTDSIWVASSFHPKSFDSRYFGPVPASTIRDYLRPIITFGR
jgi:conjugative transfer signal peptidase TraF